MATPSWPSCRAEQGPPGPLHKGNAEGQQGTVTVLTKNITAPLPETQRAPQQCPKPLGTLNICLVSKVAVSRCHVNRAQANSELEGKCSTWLWAQVPQASGSSYLKLGPVHGHAWPVIGSEPPQVLPRRRFDALLQVTVNVFVAKSERKADSFGRPPVSLGQGLPRVGIKACSHIRVGVTVQIRRLPWCAGQSSGRDAHRRGKMTAVA